MQGHYILVLNCGSSSVKFAVINPHSAENILSGLVQCIGNKEPAQLSWRFQNEPKQEKILGKIDYQATLTTILDLLHTPYALQDKIVAIGHRVVHGGEAFTKSTLITPQVLQAIQDCSRLAPLHNPANIAGIRACQAAFPDLPQVAVFDTAFHQTMPDYAYIYPIPYQLYKEHAIRRYGFHGTSHRFVTQQAAQILGKNLNECAFVSAHLGNGCSATAVLNGKSLDTSMGLTPLEGLVMGTRSGDVDPSLHAYLADNLGYDVHKVTDMLNKESGLLGISEKNSDLRAIESAIQKGDKQALLAVEVFCYRLAKYIAALTIPLKRLDALLFTGGIGENSSLVRAKTINWLKIFGFVLHEERNNAHGKDSHAIITADESTIKALVIATDEELMIARDTAEII